MDDSFEGLLQQANAALRDPIMHEDSIQALENLVNARPDRAESWFNFGYVLRMQCKFDQALAAYAQAIRLRVDRPEEAYLNRAAIFSEQLDDSENALVELSQATAHNVGFSPAWLNMGQLFEDRGDIESARSSYRNILDLDPEHPQAAAKLAQIEEPSGTNVDRIQHLIAQGGLDPRDEADLWFAQASVLDRLGDYDQAFAAATRANALAAAALPARSRYNPQKSEALVGTLLSLDYQKSKVPISHSTPIFVCGMFRSGSTLAEAILGRHSAITACGERNALPWRYQNASARTELATGSKAMTELASADEIRRARASYLDSLGHLKIATGYYTDKRPDNISWMGFAEAMFPDLKIIITRRHPLDNLISSFFLNFADGVPYSVDLDQCCHWMTQSARLTNEWTRRWPEKVQFLDYESVIEDAESAFEPVMNMLDLDWEASCLDASAPLPAIRTPSSVQVRQPLYRRSVSRWKNYEKYLGRQREFLQRSGLCN